MNSHRWAWVLAVVSLGCSRSELPSSLDRDSEREEALRPRTDDAALPAMRAPAPRPSPTATPTPTATPPAPFNPIPPAPPTAPAVPPLTPPSPPAIPVPTPDPLPDPPPEPDACELDLHLGDVVGYSTFGVTSGLDRYKSSCGGAGQSGPETIFGWTAPRDGCFQFDTQGSEYDTVLHAHDRCPSGPELRCNDDGGESFQSTIYLEVLAGQELAIVVDGFSADSSGLFMLNINECREHCSDFDDNDLDGLWDCDDPDCAEASNCIFEICDNGVDDDGDGLVDCEDPECWTDECAEDCFNGIDDDGDGLLDCEDLSCRFTERCLACSEANADLGSALGELVSGDLAEASRSLSPSCASGTGGSLLFTWTPPDAGCYIISTFGSTYDTVLHVHSSCPAFVELSCNDDHVGTTASSLTLDLSPDETYSIGVTAYAPGYVGNYSLQIERCAFGATATP